MMCEKVLKEKLASVFTEEQTEVLCEELLSGPFAHRALLKVGRPGGIPVSDLIRLGTVFPEEQARVLGEIFDEWFSEVYGPVETDRDLELASDAHH